MSHGESVEQLDLQVNPFDRHQSRVALTGAAQAIALGGTYRNLRLWLDTGASSCSVRINPAGTTTAADANDPRITDGDAYRRSFQRGITTAFIFSNGSTGSINVEAWG